MPFSIGLNAAFRRVTIPLALRLQLLAVGLSLLTTPAWSETSQTVNPTPVAITATAHSGPQWHELKGTQRQILEPLVGAWGSLTPDQKSKWVAISRNYVSMVPADQEKLKNRMVEWAALKPQERQQARLNFAETKKFAPTERASNWDAYQALSPDEKKNLAKIAPPKPAGAAIAVKPATSDKLTTVPLTRLTPLQAASAPASKPAIDRHTLLPKPNRPTAGASAPTN